MAVEPLRDQAVAALRAHALIGNRRKECACGWHQNSYGTTELNHPHHVAEMLRLSGLLAFDDAVEA